MNANINLFLWAQPVNITPAKIRRGNPPPQQAVEEKGVLVNQYLNHHPQSLIPPTAKKSSLLPIVSHSNTKSNFPLVSTKHVEVEDVGADVLCLTVKYATKQYHINKNGNTD